MLLTSWRRKEERKHYETLSRLLRLYGDASSYQSARNLYEWLLSDEARLFYSSGLELDRGEALLGYIKCREALDAAHVAQEVQKRKFRLGAGPPPVIKAAVESEIVQTSDIDRWYVRALEHLDEGSAAHGAVREKHARFLFAKCPFIADPAEKRQIVAQFRQIALSGYVEELFEAVLDLSDADYASEILLLAERYEGSRFSSEVAFLLGRPVDNMTLDKASVFSAWMNCQWNWSNSNYEGVLSCITVLTGLVKAAQTMYAVGLPKIQLQAERYEFLGLARTERFEAAKGQAARFSDDDLEMFEAKLAICRGTDNVQGTIALLSKAVERFPESAVYASDLGWCYFSLREYAMARQLLEKADALSADNAGTLYRIARVHWDSSGDRAVPLNLLLRAVKADPQHAESFLFLGHYYREHADLVRAEKCYSKALRLDDSIADAAVGLAQIWVVRAWDRHDQQPSVGEAVARLLAAYTHDNLRNWQLWKFLGIAHSWTGAAQKAISAFQNALKAEHADELECLGLLAEAYRKDRKLSAALKAYSRALVVQPDCVSARIGLATTKMEVGIFDESIELFSEIICEAGTELVGPLKLMLAKTYHAWALELISSSMLVGAVEACRSGLLLLVEIHTVYESFGVWKLLSDCLSLLLHFRSRPEYSELARIAETVAVQASGMEPIRGALKDPVLEAAIGSLFKALGFLGEPDAKLKADTLSSIARLVTRAATEGAIELQAFAESCVVQALQHNLACSEAWNIYGLVAMAQGRYPLSQHCCISALETAPEGSATSHIWMNLALLYLRLGDIELVMQAVEKAQMADVENPVSWFANAQVVAGDPRRIFELVEEAVQCPRASTHLETNREYVRMALGRLGNMTEDGRRVLLNNLAIALQRVHDLTPGDATYANLLGTVLERGEGAGVVDLFRTAMDASTGEQREMVQANLARALVCAGRYDEAVEPGADPSRVEQFLAALRSARLAKDASPLGDFTEASVFGEDGQLWELAVWETGKLRADPAFLQQCLAINPESVGAAVFKMLGAADPDEAEGLLMQVLGLITGEGAVLDLSVLWVVTGYMCSKGLFEEAVRLYISLVTESIMDPSVWESFAQFMDELRLALGGTEDAEESRSAITLLVKEWLDIEVPQLDRKPKMEDMESYYVRIFPRIEDPSSSPTRLVA